MCARSIRTWWRRHVDAPVVRVDAAPEEIAGVDEVVLITDH